MEISGNFENYINHKVTTGVYPNPNAVVEAAINLMEQQEKLAALRADIALGMQGPYTEWNLEESLEKFRLRKAELDARN